MPKSFKHALITPIPKKPNAQSDMKNYRPISNLPFVSKVIERIVINQLSEYCDQHNLNESLQSAYRHNHSTETALLKVTNDILVNMDNQSVTLLTLLDLSAAFDTVPHDRFLERLDSLFGIQGVALQWFRSYFKDRVQQVIINGAKSDSVALTTGMPQGSGLGPWGYTRYTHPLGHIIQLLIILYHIFADDTQLYKSVSPNSIESQMSGKTTLERCINDVSDWMSKNKLKLNDSKTEFMIIGNKRQTKKMQYSSINVGDECINASSSVRDLGVIIDHELKLKEHVHQIVKKSYSLIRWIKSIREYLTISATKSLVHAIIVSRLDYCNSLLFGISETLLDELQRVQNAAARLILGLRKRDHISGALKSLHWLPIRHRIKYKLAVITYKVLNTGSPSYLRELLTVKEAPRTLRSNRRLLLEVPRTKLKTAGDRAFQTSAPTVWNSLPEHLKNCKSVELFKKQLKTHLFSLAYSVQ